MFSCTEVDAQLRKLISCFEGLRRNKLFPVSSYSNYYLEQDQSPSVGAYTCLSVRPMDVEKRQ